MLICQNAEGVHRKRKVGNPWSNLMNLCTRRTCANLCIGKRYSWCKVRWCISFQQELSIIIRINTTMLTDHILLQWRTQKIFMRGVHSVACGGHFYLVCGVCDVTRWRHIHVSKPTFSRNLLTQYAYYSIMKITASESDINDILQTFR